MKKFTKLLFLLLALVAIVTAFTVVTLANELPAPTTLHANDFANTDIGTSLAGSGGGKGQAIVTEADDGNRYVLMSYKDGASGARWDVQWNGSAYSVGTYHLLFEFDVMTANGSYESTSVYPRSFNTFGDPEGKNSIGFITGLSMNLSSLGLSSEPYEWQHISIVIEYDSASGKFNEHAYVNGEFVKTQTSSSTYTGFTGRGVDFIAFNPTTTASNGSQVGVDNIKATYFSNAYSLDAIADYFYKGGEGYEFPYGKTVASVIDGGNETKFDNIEEAYANANANNTLKLYADAACTVAKAMTVDTNGFAFDFTVADGYALSSLNGIYTFDEAANAIKVVWDPDCGNANCNCYGGLKHANNATAYFLNGSELPFPGEAVGSANGVVTTFLGWSYTKGATVAEEITHVDATKAVENVITLYPVYDLENIVKYDAEVIVDGESSFIFEEAFVSTFNSIANGGTIKLHNNIAIYETLVPTYSGQTNTIDLNGFGLYRLGTNYTDYQALSDGNGGYTKGNQLATQPTAVAYGDLLKTGTHDNILNVITSRPGASIYSASVTADRLLDGDKVVGSTLNAIKFNTIFDTYGGQRNTINLTGDITTMSYILFYCEHGASSGSSFNIDGGVHVTVGGSSGSAPTLMHVTVGGNHSIKNATIVASSYIVRHDKRSNECIVTIDNCNIIGGYMQFDSDDNGTETGKVTITNSRVSGISGFVAFSPIVAGNITWLDKAYDKIGILEGNAQESTQKVVTYTIPSTSTFAMNPETFLPQYTETTKTVTYTLVNLRESDLVEVAWKDANGDTIRTDATVNGELLNAPEVKLPATDGYVNSLIGWSYTEGAASPDNIVFADVNHAVDGVITIYPVFDANAVKYDAEIIIDGFSSFIFADAFADTFTSLTGNATIKLHSDIAVYTTLNLKANQEITVDLNGYSLYRLGTVYTDYQALSDGNGGYTKGDALESPTDVAHGCLFDINATGVTLNIITSRSGAAMYSAKVVAERLLLDGEVVGTASSEAIYKTLIQLGSAGGTVNITGDITTFSQSLIYSTSAASINLNIDGGAHIKNAKDPDYNSSANNTDGLLYIHCGTVNLKNATFYTPGYLFRYLTGYKLTMTMDNCNILGTHFQFDSTNKGNGSWTITNSRISGLSLTAYSPILAGSRTWFDKDLTQIGETEGQSLIPKTQTITYTIPAQTLSVDPVTLLPYYTTTTKTVTYNFVALGEEDYTNVTWLGAYGEEIETGKFIKGETITAPAVKVPAGDGYRAFTNPTWLDNATNEAFSLVLGELDSYTFKPSTELPAEPEYVAYIEEVLFNMSYKDMFAYYLYVPVAEGVEVTLVGNYAPTIVKIDGKEYYTGNFSWNSVDTAISSIYASVKYTIDGVNYTYKTPTILSALFYAETVCEDVDNVLYSKVEQNAMLSMMAYLEQIYKLSGKLEANQATFDSFFTKYGEPTTLNPENDQTVYTIKDELGTYVTSMQYALHTSGRLSFGITLTADTYTIKTNSFGKLSSELGLTRYSMNNSIISLIEDNYNIQISDASGLVIAQDYNLATYRASLENDEDKAFVDAIYTFTKSVEAVRAYLGGL